MQSKFQPKVLINKELKDKEFVVAFNNAGFVEDLILRLMTKQEVKKVVITTKPLVRGVQLEVVGQSGKKSSVALPKTPKVEPLDRLKAVLTKLWKASENQPPTLREAHQPLRRHISHSDMKTHLQKLEKEQFLKLEEVTRKNGAKTILIHPPATSKEKGEDRGNTAS